VTPASLSIAAGSGALQSPPVAAPVASVSGPTQPREISIFENVRIGPGQTPSASPEPQVSSHVQNVSVDAETDVRPTVSRKPAQPAKPTKSPARGNRRKMTQAQPLMQSAGLAPATASTVEADALLVATAPAPEGSAANASAPSSGSAAEPSKALQPKAEAAPKDGATRYLEVGSFKDETWANNAADKLQELGYHTALVHKNVLWMQSYHVQVGPYASPQEVADAQKSLAAQGYKAHPSN